MKHFAVAVGSEIGLLEAENEEDAERKVREEFGDKGILIRTEYDLTEAKIKALGRDK